MNEFVTVRAFTYPHEAEIVKGVLEAEGVECNIKDGFTAQANPLYSDAIGGVKLQVREDEVEIALEILKSVGYLPSENKDTPLVRELDKLTSRIPVLNKLEFVPRFLVIVGFYAVVILLIVYFATRPDMVETLTSKYWCVDYVSHEGNNYEPKTTGVRIIFPGVCNERLDLRKNGELNLPGFNSEPIYGKWKYDGDKLRITKVDMNRDVFVGDYNIKLDDNRLTLSSDSTIIYCWTK